MVWTLQFKGSVQKDLSRVPPPEQKRILKFLQSILENPRSRGKPLTGEKRELWRYRVGRYRVICDIQDQKLVVMVIRVGHRKDVYR